MTEPLRSPRRGDQQTGAQQKGAQVRAPKALDHQKLSVENVQFARTCGLSANNAHQDFVPAFRHEETGEVALARFADGRVAPMHLIINLPEEWATARNARGQISAVQECVIAGFVHDGQFFTRAEAAAAAG